jgi:preprotein translocase subunit SecF
METDDQLKVDLEALARDTTRGLPTLDDTRRALDAHGAYQGALMSKIRKPLLGGTLAVAAATAILLCPVPYMHQRGFDLSIARRDGRVVKVHLRGNDRGHAEVRAKTLAHGGEVTLSPHIERVWGSVYAMAEEKLLHVDIDMEGKTDAQVEDEITAQLAAAGWTAEDVQVQRTGDGSRISIKANNEDGDGPRLMVVTKAQGEGSHVQMDSLAIERTPGMTDAELRQKILDQMKARGMSGEVTVDNGQVRIQARELRP